MLQSSINCNKQNYEIKADNIFSGVTKWRIIVGYLLQLNM